MAGMAEQEKWQWQEPGTAWKGAGLYHVTLTVPSREPLFGTLVIPGYDPTKARIERTALGNAVVDELYVMCRHYPAIRILQFCLMPDHLHAVIHVTRAMDTSIRAAVRGYWQGVKKLGRAYTLAVAADTLAVAAELNSATNNEGGTGAGTQAGSSARSEGGAGAGTQAGSGTLAGSGTQAGAGSGGGFPFPIFTERPFIRPLSRRGQLRAMIRYVQMNPQRLATKAPEAWFVSCAEGYRDRWTVIRWSGEHGAADG